MADANGTKSLGVARRSACECRLSTVADERPVEGAVVDALSTPVEGGDSGELQPDELSVSCRYRNHQGAALRPNQTVWHVKLQNVDAHPEEH